MVVVTVRWVWSNSMIVNPYGRVLLLFVTYDDGQDGNGDDDRLLLIDPDP